MSLSPVKSPAKATTPKKVSTINSSIEAFSAKGTRTQALKTACNKFDTFKELDSILKNNGLAVTSPMMSPEYKEHIMAKKAQRAKMLSRLSSMPSMPTLSIELPTSASFQSPEPSPVKTPSARGME